MLQVGSSVLFSLSSSDIPISGRAPSGTSRSRKHLVDGLISLKSVLEIAREITIEYGIVYAVVIRTLNVKPHFYFVSFRSQFKHVVASNIANLRVVSSDSHFYL